MSQLSVLFYGRMKREGITQKELSSAMSASPNTVRKWLNHPETMPLVTLLELCRCIGVRQYELFAAIKKES